ncbi:hypothetical protein ACLB1E_01100 [Escherichia coli]
MNRIITVYGVANSSRIRPCRIT